MGISLNYYFWLPIRTTLICNFVPRLLNFCAITNHSEQYQCSVSFVYFLGERYKVEGRVEGSVKVSDLHSNFDVVQHWSCCLRLPLLARQWSVFLHKHSSIFIPPFTTLISYYQSVDIWIPTCEFFSFNIDVVNVVRENNIQQK